ncbi:hypothetical protein D3C81_1473850 [compost metagenome]
MQSGKFDTTPTVNKADTTSFNAPDAATPTSGSARSFNYQPEKPVDGEYKGVVEVGASGFNSFVVNMDKENRWEIISKDFGKSFAYEGLANTEDIRKGLKDYIRTQKNGFCC